jgi:hypothetical protein
MARPGTDAEPQWGMEDDGLATLGLPRKYGRPLGSINITKTIAGQRAREILESPEYTKTLLDRAKAGTLGPMEQVLWHYAYGKPTENINMRMQARDEDMADLSNTELLERVEQMQNMLQEAQAVEEAIETEFDRVN